MKLKPQIYKPQRRSSMSKLSEDLIFEILSWLPATTLVRFRFVSKSWFNLITTSSCFIQSQLDRGSRIDNHSIFFYNIDEVPSTMEFKDGNSTPLSPPSHVKSAVLPMESMVYKPAIVPSYCVGSCNGLICFNLGMGVGVRPSTEHERHYIDDNYYLWNPSTNEFKHIPSAPIVNIPSNSRVYVGWRGFGYDRGLADYKIVSIVAFISNEDTNITVEVMVYTLGTNSWRNARHGCDKSTLCYKPAEISGLEVNGSLHWIGRNWGQRSGYCLMSFDIADESFEEVPPPPSFTDMHQRPTLYVLRDCLCVLLNSCRDGSRVEVWMMKDYGVKESWVKLFSTTHPSFTTHGRISNLLWMCKNGEIQVQIETSSMAGSFVLYNPKTGEVKFLKWPSPHSYRGKGNTKVYHGSLVHLKSGETLRSATLERYWHRLAEFNTRLFTYCL